jgi:hypothetical protein
MHDREHGRGRAGLASRRVWEGHGFSRAIRGKDIFWALAPDVLHSSRLQQSAMSNSDQERCMQELRERQRNVVFPDTLRNEAAGWHRLMSGKRPLTIVQAIGIGFMFLAMGAVFWGAISDKLHHSAGTGWTVNRFVDSFADWIILFAIFGALFLLLRWRVRRALRADKVHSPSKRDLD